MQIEIHKTDGSGSGKKVKLPDEVFGVEPNTHAVYMAVKVQNANARQGTVATKTRSMVRGGGKKPWKQKGRGVARAGTTRSPVWVGGGRVFGPQPRDYSQSLPRKVKKLARVSALSDKAKNKQITVIEDFKLDNPKTREMFAILKALGLDSTKTLLLTADHDPSIIRAGRNIPNLVIREASHASTYDILNCQRIVIQRGAIAKLSGGASA